MIHPYLSACLFNSMQFNAPCDKLVSSQGNQPQNVCYTCLSSGILNKTNGLQIPESPFLYSEGINQPCLVEESANRFQRPFQIIKGCEFLGLVSGWL